MNKTLSGNIKAVRDDGTATVIFATLNVIDKDGDFTLPGAFGSQMAKIAGAHDWQAPPLGSAAIYERGDKAYADLTFNLDIPLAVDWHKALKFNFANNVTQEYSYGFDILEESPETARQVGARRALKSLRVHEVSPVMVGAGVGTRTVAVKTCQSCGGESRSHGSMEQHFEIAVDYLNREIQIQQIRQKDGRGVNQPARERIGIFKSKLRGLEEIVGVDLELLDVEIAESRLQVKPTDLHLLEVENCETLLRMNRGLAR